MGRSVVLVPGIKTDGYGSIFNLQQPLEQAGLDVYLFQYPHTSFLDTFSRKKSDENARLLFQLCADILDICTL